MDRYSVYSTYTRWIHEFKLLKICIEVYIINTMLLLVLINMRMIDHPHVNKQYLGAVSQGNASTICLAVHSAVGFVVTLKWTTWRRAWLRIIKTYKISNLIVGTTRKSTATISFMWFLMKVRQVWEDDFRGCRPNRPDTVCSDISIPSLSSSPWILVALSWLNFASLTRYVIRISRTIDHVPSRLDDFFPYWVRLVGDEGRCSQ